MLSVSGAPRTWTVREIDSPTQTLAVSDLHFGALFSAWKRDLPALIAGLRQADAAVFVGDMFEGTGMLVPLEIRIDITKRVMDLVARAARRRGNLPVDIILGNHEEPQIRGGRPREAEYLVIRDILIEKANEHSDIFRIVESGVFQRGDAAFTHGHLQTRFIEDEPTRSRQWAHLGLNVVCPGVVGDTLIFPTGKQRQMILEELSREQAALGSEETPGIRRIFTGHTHSPTPAEGAVEPSLSPGVVFHNMGASIRGRPALYQPLIICQDKDGRTTDIIDKSRFKER